MFNLDRIQSDGCALLAPYLQNVDQPDAGRLTMPKAVAFIADNIGKIFVFDRADIGAYLAAFPEIWKMRITGTVEASLKMAVTEAVKKSVVTRYYVEAAGLDFTIPADRAFPEEVSVRTAFFRAHAEANGLHARFGYPHPLNDAPRVMNTIDLLCSRILHDRDLNDFRLLGVNIDNLVDMLTPVFDEAGQRLFTDKVLLSFGQLGDFASMVANGAQPLPEIDDKWVKARVRSDTDKEERAARRLQTEGSQRQEWAQRYAVDTEPAMTEFHSRYGMTAATFMEVKKSLESHYGMKPGAIMQFMMWEHDLSFDLWHSGFVEISDALETAMKGSGRTPSVLSPKVRMDSRVRACFGRLDGFENDIVPEPPLDRDWDYCESDFIDLDGSEEEGTPAMGA